MPFLIVFGSTFLFLAWAILWRNSSLLAVTHWRGSRRHRQVALTFDDGPDPQLTPLVLDILAEKGVQATFFCIGEEIRKHPELARRIHAEGHQLANHSLEHDWRMNLWHPNRVARSLVACGRLIARHTGAPPRFYRAPVGIKNPGQAFIAWKLGLEFIGWTRGARDGGRRALTPESLNRLADAARPGDVLLLHDGRRGIPPGHPAYEQTRRTLREHLGAQIDLLRERGLEPVRLDGLLSIAAALDSDSRRQRKQAFIKGVFANMKSISRQMLHEHAGPGRLAAAVGLGVVIGCTPLFGLHALIGLVTSIKLRLNKVAVFLGTNISNPLTGWMVIVTNIEVGCRLITGQWLPLKSCLELYKNHSALDFGNKILLYWVAGLPIVATAIAAAVAVVMYFCFRAMQLPARR